MTELFKKFSQRFNKNDSSSPELESKITNLESELEVKLPSDYRIFLSQFGDLWTPGISDLIVDNKLELTDVQDFWNCERIVYDKKRNGLRTRI